MSFTLVCDNCREEYKGTLHVNMPICDLCGKEGCDICLDLVSCNCCSRRVCSDCDGDNGKCSYCEENEKDDDSKTQKS